MDGVLSTFYSENGIREAHVRKDSNGFYVDLLIDGIVQERRVFYGYSESYAESCAENFVLGIFDIESLHETLERMNEVLAEPGRD